MTRRSTNNGKRQSSPARPNKADAAASESGTVQTFADTPSDQQLIRLGMAMLFAQVMEGRLPTQDEVAYWMEGMPEGDFDKHSAEEHLRLRDLGRQDPRPFVERLKRACRQLRGLLKGRQAEGQLLDQVLATVTDLELVLALRRYGGRPKGKRHKVTPEQIETIRRWMKGDRSVVASGSVTELAGRLGLARQTIYTIRDQIRAEEKQASGDESKQP